MNIYYEGLIFGVIAFFAIGVFHPIVIKAEYYFSKKIWPVFLIFGLIFCVLSVFFKSNYWSIIFGVIGFASFWSVHELFKQHERVLKGRAKMNPNRKYQ